METKEPAEKTPDNTPANTWVCPFCQQKIRIGAYGFCPSAAFFERCLLKDHIVDDECVAYRNPRKAGELMKERN